MILHIDIPIIVSPIHEDRTDALPGSLLLVQTGEQVIDGVTRRYYAAHPPLRLHLVTRNIPFIPPLDSHVQGIIGWDNGESPYTLPQNARRKHTKLTFFSMFGDDDEIPPDSEFASLAAILATVPRSDRPGGSRPGAGRHLMTASRTNPYSVTLPANMAAWLTALGDGNLSSGIRKATAAAGYVESN